MTAVSFAQPIVQSDFQGMPEKKSAFIEGLRADIHHLKKEIGQSGVLSDIYQWKVVVEKDGLTNELRQEYESVKEILPIAADETFDLIHEEAIYSPETVHIPSFERAIADAEKMKSSRIQKLKDKLETLKSNSTELIKKQKELCGANKDLSHEFPNPKERNQTNINWCYAFAVADLAGYYTKDQISAADIAVRHNEALKKPEDLEAVEKRKAHHRTGILEFGIASTALTDVVENGYCLEKDLPSEAFRFDQKNLQIKNVYEEIEVYQQAAKKFPEIANPYCEAIYNRSAGVLFPSIQFQDFKKIFDTVEANKLIQVLGKKSCEGKRKPFVKGRSTKTRAFADNRTSANMEFIAKKIEANDPIIINVDMKVLNANPIYAGQDGSRNAHSILVTGKRWNTEKQICEFKIRNSWGAQNYSQWMPAGVLIPATSHAVTLDKND